MTWMSDLQTFSTQIPGIKELQNAKCVSLGMATEEGDKFIMDKIFYSSAGAEIFSCV